MARLSQSQWDAIRTVWEYDPDEPSHEVAADRAGKKYQFKPPAKSNVYARCIKDKWERRGSLNGINAAAQRKADSLTDSAGNRTKQNEQNVEAGGKQNAVPNPALAQASRADSENLRAEVTARHRTEWKNIAVLRQEALAVRNSNPDQAMFKSKLAKINAETTAIQQAGERKAWGLDILVDPGALKDMTDEQLEAIINGKTAA